MSKKSYSFVYGDFALEMGHSVTHDKKTVCQFSVTIPLPLSPDNDHYHYFSGLQINPFRFKVITAVVGRK